MAENTTITIARSDKQEQEVITTNGYLVIYLKGEEFKFLGDLNIKDLAPMLIKMAMQKMAEKV